MQRPSTTALEAALAVVAYAYHSCELKLTYGGEAQAEGISLDLDLAATPVVYADASFGAEVQPMAGGGISWRGAWITWLAKGLKFTPQSSSESEVGAMNLMAKEARFVYMTGQDMGIKMTGPIVMLTDSKSGRDIMHNPGVTKHSTHFQRRLYFVREMFLNGELVIHLIGTNDMMADWMTKPVDRDKFFRCRNHAMGSISEV